MNSINICNLPDLALNEIANNLDPNDLIQFSDSAPCFEDLRRYQEG